MIEFCSLGSGSKGNGTLIRFADTVLLIDCGFSLKEVLRRLAIKKVKPEQITAILVTHEHADHLSGAPALSNKYSIPIWLSKGTSLHKKCSDTLQLNIINSHNDFTLGDFKITPVAVPHDSREAVQFVFSAEGYKLGLLTDVGEITNHIVTSYSGCHALLLEFNYDAQMLANSRYPYSLKQRVAGNLGHLSNHQSIDFLKRTNLDKLSFLGIMHCSEENNSEIIIRKAIDQLSELNHLEYLIASQSEGFDWQLVSEDGAK